jgi:asparagine synthase (glutamine-hydrolysing)
MSAINGIVHFDDEPIPLEHRVNLMKALEKYPADDIHTWHKDSLFLGCHAQWITPESIGERLPYYDKNRQLAITADAILDNRKELFHRLQVEQGDLKTITDSELILLAYYKWGDDAPKFLIGDFAFMIWDERNRRLFGARDFSGSRTLYFHRAHLRFAFCTTIQPLLSLPYIEKQLNEQWMAEYLANPGMVEAVDGSTVYKKIEQVPPSHSISVTGGKVALSQYCKLSEVERLKLKSDQEYEEAFREIFQRSVTDRLRTYRQVGANLSGGLDSGSVVSFAARALHKENNRLLTYSYIPVNDYIDWTPKNRIADERPFIQSTVQHVGNITDHYLDFEGKSPLTDVNDWLEILEMPYKVIENSFWIRGIYEKASEQGVGVLLSGARGNFTISWGPALSYYAMLLKKLQWIRLYREMHLYSKNQGVGRSRIMTAVGQKAFPFMERMIPFKDQYLHRYPLLINPELAQRTGVLKRLQAHGIDATGFARPRTMYEARRKHFEQTFSWNLNGIFGTMMSLRYSIWHRDPTNDLRVIRFCLSVPEEQYVQNGMDRALIRRSTENLLPDHVRLNQRLRGIQGADGIHRMIPAWDAFIDELHQLSGDPVVSEYINVPVVKEAISQIQEKSRSVSPSNVNFNILMRSLIVSRFIKKNS